jgi:hypothetical protein
MHIFDQSDNNSMYTEGVDFIGPDPSMLTFTSGQSTGDIQCGVVTILNNSILEGEHRFSIELEGVHSETSVKINETMMSEDIDDRKFVPAINLLFLL